MFAHAYLTVGAVSMVLGCNGANVLQATCKNEKSGPTKSLDLEGMGMLQKKKERKKINVSSEFGKTTFQKENTDGRWPKNQNLLCWAMFAMPDPTKMACSDGCPKLSHAKKRVDWLCEHGPAGTLDMKGLENPMCTALRHQHSSSHKMCDPKGPCRECWDALDKTADMFLDVCGYDPWDLCTP